MILLIYKLTTLLVRGKPEPTPLFGGIHIINISIIDRFRQF